MLTLYLIRHGETAWNAERRLQGQTDVPLSKTGQWQADRIAARLASAPIQAVWSSDLRRARETAERIASPHGLPVIADSALREVAFGQWEGLTEAEIIARGDERLWRRYIEDSIAHRPPEGELLEEVSLRLLGVVREIRAQHPDGGVALVGHGGSLRAIIADALAATLTSWRRIRLDNASLSVIEYGEQRPLICLLNDCCHLRGP